MGRRRFGVRVAHHKIRNVAVGVLLGIMGLVPLLMVSFRVTEAIVSGSYAQAAGAVAIWAAAVWFAVHLKWAGTAILDESGITRIGAIGKRHFRWSDIEHSEVVGVGASGKDYRLFITERGTGRRVHIEADDLENTEVMKRAAKLAAEGRPEVSAELVNEHGEPLEGGSRPSRRIVAASAVIVGVLSIWTFGAALDNEAGATVGRAEAREGGAEDDPAAFVAPLRQIASDGWLSDSVRCDAARNLVRVELDLQDPESALSTCELFHELSCIVPPAPAESGCATIESLVAADKALEEDDPERALDRLGTLGSEEDPYGLGIRLRALRETGRTGEARSLAAYCIKYNEADVPLGKLCREEKRALAGDEGTSRGTP